MDYHHLLYVLEKVKAACYDAHAVYYSRVGSEEHDACLQLAQDGLIRKYTEDGDSFLWKYGKR